MAHRNPIETVQRPEFKTSDGRVFDTRWEAEEHEQKRERSAKFREAVREAAAHLYRTMSKHGYSGIADSEGHAAMYHWMKRKLEGGKATPISFQSLSGYSSYKPEKPGQLTKSEIAAEVRVAANELFRVAKKSLRILGHRYPLDSWESDRVASTVIG